MKKSFRDPVTHRLKAYGYVLTNQPGDLIRDEPDDFTLKPGEFQFDGAQWQPIPQATLDGEGAARQRQKGSEFLSSPDGSYKLLRAAFDVARDEINVLRSIIPRPLVSITRVGTVATATCYVAHGLTNGTVFITGAAVAAYNGAKSITVTSPTAFTYAVAGSPATPAAGSISFVLATITSLAPRTFEQFRTAIENRIADGTVDT